MIARIKPTSRPKDSPRYSISTQAGLIIGSWSIREVHEICLEQGWEIELVNIQGSVKE